MTEWKIPDDALRNSDSLRDMLFDTSPLFWAGIAADGRLVTMNTTMLHALGYTADEVIGKDYMSMFVPERDRDLLRGILAQLSEMNGPTLNENWVRAKDGTERLVEWHGNVVRNAAGEFEFYIGIGTDITERRSVEQALRRSEEKLALHVQQTPLGVIEFDLGHRITEWNPSATRIFGYSRDEVLGRNAIDLMVPEPLRAHIRDLWNDLIVRRGGIRSTNENITKSGTLILCEWYNTPLVDAGGTIIGVASHVDDVTEQKRIEAELRRREQSQAETIEQLSAPILDLWEGVVAMPVIGEVDERRAARMTENLLAAILRVHASFTVIDLTGIDRMDSRVADYVLKMVRAAGLLGCRCLICGISPESAQTMVQIDQDLGGLHTFGTLRDALGYVLRLRGTGPERNRAGI